jgi:hypothetical protein
MSTCPAKPPVKKGPIAAVKIVPKKKPAVSSTDDDDDDEMDDDEEDEVVLLESGGGTEAKSLVEQLSNALHESAAAAATPKKTAKKLSLAVEKEIWAVWHAVNRIKADPASLPASDPALYELLGLHLSVEDFMAKRDANLDASLDTFKGWRKGNSKKAIKSAPKAGRKKKPIGFLQLPAAGGNFFLAAGEDGLPTNNVYSSMVGPCIGTWDGTAVHLFET